MIGHMQRLQEHSQNRWTTKLAKARPKPKPPPKPGAPGARRRPRVPAETSEQSRLTRAMAMPLDGAMLPPSNPQREVWRAIGGGCQGRDEFGSNFFPSYPSHSSDGPTWSINRRQQQRRESGIRCALRKAQQQAQPYQPQGPRALAERDAPVGQPEDLGRPAQAQEAILAPGGGDAQAVPGLAPAPLALDPNEGHDAHAQAVPDLAPAPPRPLAQPANGGPSQPPNPCSTHGLERCSRCQAQKRSVKHCCNSGHHEPRQNPQHYAPLCTQHSKGKCNRCKAGRRSADYCCRHGHHGANHTFKAVQLRYCTKHSLPTCPRCHLKGRGVRHCCQRHHKVHTPATKGKAKGKRAAQQEVLDPPLGAPLKRRRTTSPSQMQALHRPREGPTPPSARKCKRRRKRAQSAPPTPSLTPPHPNSLSLLSPLCSNASPRQDARVGHHVSPSTKVDRVLLWSPSKAHSHGRATEEIT